jgi:hypothetical protein
MFSYNAEGVEMGGKFAPAPVGVYTLKIIEATEKTTKNGDPMISVKCEIDDTGSYLGTTVWNNVVFIPKGRKGAGIGLEFLKAIGQPFEGQLEIDANNWIGKSFRAKLGIEKDLKGNDRNKIAYLVEDGADEVPF